MLILLKVFGLGILVPLGILFIGIHFLCKNGKTVLSIGCKLIIVGLASFFIVNVSVGLSNYVYAVNRTSIESTISDTNEVAEYAESVTMENAQAEIAEETDSENSQGWWDGFTSAVSDTFNSAIDSITGALTSAYDWAKTTLSRFVEAVLVMVLVCVVIPIATVVFYILFVRWALRYNTVRLTDAINDASNKIMNVVVPKNGENA